MEIGHVNEEKNNDQDSTFPIKVTDTIARSKGLSLQRQNVNGLITKNLMREFLQGLAENKSMEIAVPQFRFEITPKSYKIKPKNIKNCIATKGCC